MPLRSTSFSTGTTSPSGVSTATPMLQYFLRIRLSLSGLSEALNSGNARIDAALAFSKKESSVTR